MNKLLIVLSISGLPTLASAQFFEARSTAMGGTGVAAARYLVAPLANPALLARYDEDDTVGVLAPSVGVLISDRDELIDAVDSFQSAVDRAQTTLAANGSLSLAESVDLITRLNSLGNRPLTAEVGANLVVALPIDGLSFAFVARSYGDMQAGITVVPSDFTLIQNATSSADLDNLQSFGSARSALVTDIGVSVATSFDFEAFELFVGVTPKYQRVDTYNYVIDVNNYEDDDFSDSRFRADDSSFNADLGAAIQFPFGLSVGAMVRDVVREGYRTPTVLGQSAVYTVNPVGTLGAAWSNELFTVTAELDVNATERFNLNDDSHYVRLGAEFNAWDWGQLRLGAQFDTENTTADILTGGFGFSPLDTFHLDIAGLIGDDNTYGAVLQTAFTF